jgi:hypothetical protein
MSRFYVCFIFIALLYVLQSQGREESGDCCSYPTSNGDSTENWARCSETADDDLSRERQNFAEPPFDDAEEEKVLVFVFSDNVHNMWLCEHDRHIPIRTYIGSIFAAHDIENHHCIS